MEIRMEPSEAVRSAAKQVVAMLVAGEYSAIADLTKGRDLTAEAMGRAVREYGRTLRMPPDGSLRLDAILVRGSRPPRWHVHVDLWTIEEGRSDLTLALWLDELEDGGVDVQVLDLHVL